MTVQDQMGNIVGATAYDPSGDKIGKVGAVYYDDATDKPSWVTINTGLFGTNETFVPVQGADLSGDRVTLPFDKAKVKDAPNISEDGHLSPEEEEQLYRYYGVDYGSDRTAGQTGGQYATGQRTGRDRDGDGVYDDVEGRTVGRDTSGPTTDHATTRS